MLISVVLPVYNAENFIKDAVQSILNQTFKDFELIIIDDNSSDNSLKIIEELSAADSRIVILKNNKNLKLSKTLNLGIKSAKGKYIARMDADDISLPHRLEKQFEVLESNSSCCIVGCDINIIDEKSKIISKRLYKNKDVEIRNNIFYYSPFCHPAIMMRADILKSTELYNHVFNPAEDYELYFRMGMYGTFFNINEILFNYRISSKSMTQSGLKNMELKTLEVRKIYMNKFGYRCDTKCHLYNILHSISIKFSTPSFRKKLFEWLR